jgi:hypothetical protein
VGVTDELPAAAGDPIALSDASGAVALRRGEGESWSATGEVGPGALFAAERSDRGWAAFSAGGPLQRLSSEWGNAFVVPGTSSSVELRFEQPAGYLAWLAGIGLLWLATFGAATVRRAEAKPRAVLTR